MRSIIAKILRFQAKRFLYKNQPKVIVIAGSIGKTSTTQAIATVLSQEFKVRKTIANYNTDIGVPSSIFDRKFPDHLFNIFAWIWIIIQNQFSLFVKSNIEILVLELGTDSIGELDDFAWLKPDIAVVTAIADEHMEFFETIENVAKEELSVASFSDVTIINKEMVPAKYLRYAQTEELFNYSSEDLKRVKLKAKDLKVVGTHSIDSVVAAIAVGKKLGMSTSNLQNGARLVTPQPGRMNLLKGIKNSTLIDDTYNSSPDAVIAGLDYLYSVKKVSRIALLGNMNELGNLSGKFHTKIGEYCDPTKLELVVTLGEDANKYTADSAKAKGCSVAETATPYQAAEIIKRQMRQGSYVLLNGSQNGVFAEEIVKQLLDESSDSKYLVRQSNFWMKKKHIK